MTITLIDPTIGPDGDGKPLAPRPKSLDGVVLGLVNNGKTNGREILQRVAANLAGRHAIAGSMLVTKPNASAPANPEEVAEIASGATAIIAAIGD